MFYLYEQKRAFKVLYRLVLVVAFMLLLFLMFCLLWGGMGLSLWVFAWVMTFVSPLSIGPFILLGPVSAFLFATYVSDSIRNEAALVRSHGEDKALWVSSNYGLDVRHPSYFVFKTLMWAGHDKSGDWLSHVVTAFSLPDEMKDVLAKGVVVGGSILWSRLVLWAEGILDSSFSLLASLAALWHFNRTLSGLAACWVKKTFMFSLLLLVVLWHLDVDMVIRAVSFGVYSTAKIAVIFQTKRQKVYLEWLKWRVTRLFVLLVAYSESLNSEMKRRHSAQISQGSTRLVAHFKQFTMQAAIVVNDLGLPSFVRKRMSLQPSVQLLQDSLDIMKSLGWPVNVDIAEAKDFPAASSFKEWVLCGSSFEQGIHNMKVLVDTDLETLRIAGVAYKRTEEYATTTNEIVSLSRYFKSPAYDYPDISVDDVWIVLGDIFRHSRLTPFNYIIKMWEKKYALGAFMRDPFKLRSKYSRKNFIRDINGYGPFKRLWAHTFYWASQILPTSAVSVKGEALPERKWAQDKVRTVIGSPITQYILSTIWNYGPNHRFAWTTTPIKIGMPLNGYWMTSIWERHSRCQHHSEGDMKDFDSTIEGKVKDLIVALRKKGFEFHKDRERIAELIDINYDQVTSQLLNTTSTGNVYKKGTGLTTGHSSTSMDNSSALVILYLLAWKDLTGLSAREFLHYNELSCFGDDHILSWLSIRPAVWTAKNIQATMAKWGVTNNIIVHQKLDTIPFLSKFGRKATPGEVQVLEEQGVKGRRFIVWHDKAKLIGKLTAPVRNLTPSYRLKRLLSYLTLTAHHKDIYDGIARIILTSKSMKSVMANNKWKLPSYNTVMQQWYSPSTSPDFKDQIDNAFEEFENTGTLIEYGATNLLDSVFGSLSMIPDLLSPLIFNYGYARAFQVFLKPRLSWIVDLIMETNDIGTAGGLSFSLARTPYRFLDSSLHVPGLSFSNYSSRLVRHWLFMWYCKVRPVQRWGAWLNFAISRLASLQFLINGHLMFEQKQAEFQLDYVVVCALLDLVSVPDWFGSFQSLRLPDLQLIVDLISHFLLVTVWSSVPANFKETTASLRGLNPEYGPVGVSAPTGTGKSTAFVHHLYSVLGHQYRKIIIVEPRSALVIGLVDFMQSSFGLDCSGSTTGLDLDMSKKVLYMTPQSLIVHPELLNRNNLFMLDEAHMDEPYYQVMRHFFAKNKMPVLWVTATLPDHLRAVCQLVLDIPIARIWRVDSQSEVVRVQPGVDASGVLRLARDKALDFANVSPPGARLLVFLPRISDVEYCVENCRRKSRALHSNTAMPSSYVHDVYFSTPIADVGITIPDVSVVWTPNFSEAIDGQLVQLTSELAQQRAGRTGRTCNGIYRQVNFDVPMLKVNPRNSLGQDGIRSMVLEGLPLELAMSFDAQATLKGLGFSASNLPDPKDPGVLRGLSIYFRNFMPVFRSLTAAKQSGDSSFGQPVVLHHTGVGNISSSHAQPGSSSEEDILAGAVAMIEAHMKGKPLDSNFDPLNRLSKMAGPIVAVRNLIMSFLSDPEDGQTDLLNPKNSEPSGNISDVYEINKISQVLSELSSITQT
ncbi:RNA-dependent RNA polymerase [Rutstroemia firma fusarivirus 1]|uniref:RNA-dependent RNA polymerase n=1 Tax=Rutstroemia firma fusarivirus 1 TaxID=2501220 RepID=A0AAD1ADV6_9VIRU|nr:RNA-dependent RNA polymerase [Rutstroemia firma fusarivirus 1]AZT88659.1 RNA-dependent RNA polymerase [Rutstroemia firma fusarivirus 1]